MKIKEKKEGIILHAKHAYMPNSLGFCGPDEGGRILEHLQEGKVSEQLISDLMKFEAAYPFIRMIAESTGKDVFDYEVPEAYWIGNSLLEKVTVEDFYRFTHSTLKRRDREAVKKVFKAGEADLLPHHTMYVMMSLAFPMVKGGPTVESEKRIVEQMDNCRVSWGEVKEIRRKELVVLRRPLVKDERGISLAKPVITRVRYDGSIDSFTRLKTGEKVSIHWNFACQRLTEAQARNIEAYTVYDLDKVNKMMTKLKTVFR
ncbi:MAG: DUF6390 family protein [Conexivisphaerales archaeon]